MDNHSTPIVQLNNSSVNSIPSNNQQQMVSITNDTQVTPITNNSHSERNETAVVNQILQELQNKDSNHNEGQSSTSQTMTSSQQPQFMTTNVPLSAQSQQTPIMIPHPSHQPVSNGPSQPMQQSAVSNPSGYTNTSHVGAPVTQQVSQTNTVETPSSSMTIYKQFMNEFKNPLLVAAIFLVLNHNVIRTLITKNLPKLVNDTGNYNLLGLVSISLIGGIVYYGTHRLIR